MIQSGTTTYADMYYFEEEIAKETKAAGLRGVLGQTVIQFPVADAKTPADALARAETFINDVQGRPADHAGRGAARDVHARRPDADGGARPVDAARRADADPPRRDARRGEDRAGPVQIVAGRLPRRSGVPRPWRAGGARRLGLGARDRDPAHSAASACRTTPKAT